MTSKQARNLQALYPFTATIVPFDGGGARFKTTAGRWHIATLRRLVSFRTLAESGATADTFAAWLTTVPTCKAPRGH